MEEVSGVELYSDEMDSCCSTPYVSAPSSPSRSGIFYYSAPASPMHFMLSKTANNVSTSQYSEPNSSFEFDFCPAGAATADELFCNGQIRPMKLSPLIESEDEGQTSSLTRSRSRGRDLNYFRTGSLRRRTRSMSPMRTQGEEIAGRSSKQVQLDIEDKGASSAAAGRSSKRWVFLKEFLYRSKSEGTGRNNNNNNKFWSSISFSPVIVKERKMGNTTKSKDQNSKIKNGIVSSKISRRVPSPSPHELHYTAKRAQSEEMRKKTFLPYRQGLLGCLGFSSKSYGAMNGIARALNPVYSR
ncbi:uncharacterized protein [Henckelia pumila]|uniref:uncharacterized protein n=1 Tax=Henckelia pumila TaxID=405737 RepID=UPI003C6E10D3